MNPQNTNDGLADLFGKITPAGPAALSNPATGLGLIIVTGIRLFLFVAMITLLGFMLWGAYDWIISGGDKEAIQKAQAKIRNAVVGMILTIAALAIFVLVGGDILGILKRDAAGNWTFTLPSLGTKESNLPPGSVAPTLCESCPGYYSSAAAACELTCGSSGKQCAGTRATNCGSITGCYTATCK